MALGFGVNAGTPAEILTAAGKEAESLGYTSFWVNHPGATDGIAALATAAVDTQRIELGIGVIPLHTRNTDDIARGVRRSNVPEDRLLLGVGSPNPGSLQRVRQGVTVLRTKLNCEFVVAALGPKMCELAGQVADGVLFNWLTPEYAKRSADLVRAGAAAANRPAPKLFAYVRIATGGAGAEKFVQEANRYAKIPAYAAHFERMGVSPVDTGVIIDKPLAVKRAVDAWKSAVDEVVFRAVVGREALDDYLALLRTAKPS
jgi:alkanesulfonate monooxygenase SsuD/methylene tetrahydromethanopterin reductase-like flavin-dependent oxidoreductase (luciferase family)